jgi:hypothetical protein
MNTLTEERREQLRDVFAALALYWVIPQVQRPSQREEIAHEKLAAEAYRWADAMLKVRDANSDSETLK